MPRRIKLLGSIAIEEDGRSSRIMNSDRGIALAAYLIYADDVQSREQVADLLWVSSSTRQSLTRLRELLVRVRKWLPEVQATRKTIVFQPEADDFVDLLALREGLTASNPDQLDQTLRLYEGDFLGNFYLENAPYFNEWLVVVRERLRIQSMAAHHRLCQQYAEAKAWDKGVDVARRWVALDSQDEEAHRWLIQMLADNGQVTAAFQAYESCRQYLEDELGVEPEPATTELAMQVVAWNDTAVAPYAFDTLEPIPTGELPKPGMLPVNALLPYLRNSNFVGREKTLLAIASLLAKGAKDGRSPVVALTGMGGLGKTQTAVEFCYRYGRYFPGGVFWLSFAEADNVEGEVAAIGSERGLSLFQERERLSLADQTGRVQKALQEPIPRLLIFDNCEDESLLTKWLPVTGGSRILITSRRGQWSPVFEIATLPLNVLNKPTSIALLQQLGPRLDKKAAEAIAEEVGHLPLALHLVGSFLERYQQIQPEEYLSQLQDKSLLKHPSLQGRGLSHSPTGHELNVGRTFALNIEQLDQANEVDAIAYRLLVQAACFAPGEPIPQALLRETVMEGTDDLMTMLLAEDGLARLAALGFLKLEGNESAVLHRLLVAFLLEKMVDDPMMDMARKSVETAVLKSLDEFQKGDRLLIHLPFPTSHLQHIAKTALVRMDERAARLTTSWGYHLYLNSDLENAAPYLSQARLICEQVFGNRHSETAAAFSRDGWVHMHTGDYDGAKKLYEQALAIQENLPDPDPLKLATCYRDMGVVHWRQGQYTQARHYHERELALRESAVGKEHPLTAQSLSSLGIILGQMGDLEQARFYQERALAAVADEKENADTGRLLNNLATTCSRLGDNEAARRYSEQSLRIRERIFGSMNRLTANVQNNMGAFLAESGEYEAACFHLEQALAVRKKLLGNDHILTARTLSHLGDVQRRMGLFGTAQTTLEEAVNIYETIQPNHAQMAQVLNHLGDLFVEIGNLETARALLDRAWRIWGQEKHSGRSDRAHTLISLGDWFQAADDVDSALGYYRQAEAILEAAVLPTHPDLQRVRTNLAMIETQI